MNYINFSTKIDITNYFFKNRLKFKCDNENET